MKRVNYLIVALSLYVIRLLFLSKPCNALEVKIPNSFPAILIFGDSTVDTGNNNFIPTVSKGNYFPYGKDFPGYVATGRFSNGKLMPDMIASKLGIKELVPPFLDPKLSNDDMKTGVSFASAGTGFDNLTTAISKEIYHLGCRNIVVAGLPPIGCLPIQRTLSFKDPQNRKCVEYQNSDSEAYNQKLSELLKNLEAQLSESTILYADIYTPLMDMINNPDKYGKPANI
ncbi:GDSL esterase/lipase At1g06990-like [Cucurbita pepo subsp. pepo]|uniref:GDSL esterase/lipase At1g06990-like n=1 Tax=Cucurbita pepo subsp. pepo TaxID=3664 RepID=UPI000C9D9508|nr:GDSL esterase/lipase At1g06990-like [Cucurbita pepo subsp. pepo]